MFSFLSLFNLVLSISSLHLVPLYGLHTCPFLFQIFLLCSMLSHYWFMISLKHSPPGDQNSGVFYFCSLLLYEKPLFTDQSLLEYINLVVFQFPLHITILQSPLSPIDLFLKLHYQYPSRTISFLPPGRGIPLFVTWASVF